MPPVPLVALIQMANLPPVSFDFFQKFAEIFVSQGAPPV